MWTSTKSYLNVPELKNAVVDHMHWNRREDLFTVCLKSIFVGIAQYQGKPALLGSNLPQTKSGKVTDDNVWSKGHTVLPTDVWLNKKKIIDLSQKNNKCTSILCQGYVSRGPIICFIPRSRVSNSK